MCDREKKKEEKRATRGLTQLGDGYFAYGRLAHGRWALVQLLAQWAELECKRFF